MAQPTTRAATPTEPTLRETPEAAATAVRGWDRLTGPEDFFLTTDWMRIIERTAGVPMRYLTAHRGATVTAGLATALADHTAPWTLGRPDTLLAHCAAQDLPGAAALLADVGPDPGAALLPALVCGGRHLGRTRLLLGPDGGSTEVHALVTRAEHLAAEHGARCVCFPYVDARDTVLRAVLAERGYRHHTSGAFAALPLPPGGFDGYLATLSGHRARRVRAERRRLAAASVTTSVAPLRHRDVDRLAALETQLFAKYGLTDWEPRRSADLLHAVADALGDRALVSLARHDGHVVGFGLVLAHRDQWFAHRAGFDYPRQGRLPVYYETLYYRLVEEASRHGVRAVHYGIGSTDAKRSRGCTTTTQYSYLTTLSHPPSRPPSRRP